MALYFNVGNGLVSWIPRLAGQRVVLNVDGLDWKRKKWGRFARWFIRTSERWATRCAHRVVTDSRRVQQYYLTRYGAESAYIAYGAEADRRRRPGAHLARHGLEPGRYVLFVGRLVPENCAHHLVEAVERPRHGLKCVIVGDAPYAAGYIRSLRATDRSPRRLHRLRVRRGVPRAPVERLLLRRDLGGGRHPPGAARGDGGGRRRARQRHAREPRDASAMPARAMTAGSARRASAPRSSAS